MEYIKLISAVDQCSVPMLITDLNGKVILINRAFTKVSGYSKDEIIDKFPNVLKSGICDHKFFDQMWKSINCGKTWKSEIINQSKDGIFYKATLEVNPVKDNNDTIESFVATYCDLKKTEKVEAVEPNNWAKDTFIAIISHELRDPLNSILGFSSSIPIKIERKQYEKAISFSKNIRISGEHLLEIINDILDFTKIEAGRMKLEKEKFSVKEIIEHLASQLNYFTKEKGIKLVIKISDDLPHIFADRKRMTQIIMNLVSNAVKFTPEEGMITISAVLDKDIVLTVEDTGIGIAPENQNKIFNYFEQVDRNTEEQQGIGLGLAIVKRLVDLHEGKIRVKSELNKGTVFTLSFPVDG